MNASLLFGIVLGAGFVFLVLLAVVGCANRVKLRVTSEGQRRANAIAERHVDGLTAIAMHLQLFNARESAAAVKARTTAPAERRERIAISLLSAIMVNDEMPSDGIEGDLRCAINYADALIAKLDWKPEPESEQE